MEGRRGEKILWFCVDVLKISPGNLLFCYLEVSQIHVVEHEPLRPSFLLPSVFIFLYLSYFPLSSLQVTSTHPKPSVPSIICTFYLLQLGHLIGSSHCGSAVTNPTSNHEEDAGSIPGLPQCVKGSGVAVSCGVGRRRSSDPVLLWLWCRPTEGGPRKKTTKKKKKKKKRKKMVWPFMNSIFLIFIFLCSPRLCQCHSRGPLLIV